MSDRRRVLFVAPWVPGRRRPRSLALLRSLQERADVRALVLVWNDHDAADARELDGDVVAVRGRAVEGVWRAGRALLTRRSLQQAYADAGAMREAVRTSVRDFRPDAVFFNVIRSGQWLPLVGDLPVAFDLDEIRSEYYGQVAARGRGPARWVGRVEAPRMAAAEALVVARAQSVLVSSPHDVADRATFHLVRSVPVPTPFRWDESRAVGGRLLFVGRLGYAANVEALEWFVEHVMPLLRARGVPATLRIVGAEVSSRVSRLAAPDVEIVGPVADVGVEYASAAVSVVPVRTATGVQMKLIESLGVGTPTVATRLCVELAGSAAEESCRTADTPQEWADHIEQLLGSAGAREAVSASGRRWFESNYAPTAVEGAVSRALDAVDV